MGRLAKPQKMACRICGEEFDAFAHNAMFCPKCRMEKYKAHHRKMNKRYKEKRREKKREVLGQLNRDCANVVSEHCIRSAKTKPDGVSDVRWRIELRRRKCPEYYAQFGAKA